LAFADRGGIAIGTYVAAPRPEVARLPVSLPPRPAVLAGREDLLAELHNLLTRGDSPLTVVLCGLGGVGKTSLAVEYAHRHLAEVGIAWQLAADDPTVLASGLAELAAQLGGRDLADPRDPVASAHAVLAAYPAEWLLVFDNADEESVRRFMPTAGRGRVLITSQSQHWPGRQMLDVPVLGEDVAAGFLVHRVGDPDSEAAAALASQLGGLPLALEQAAAYVQATGSTLARYLALFQDRRAEVLARGQAAGHPATVAATLGIALSRLEADAPAAAGLLRLLACLASEPVPLTLLLSEVQTVHELAGDVADAVEPLQGDQLAAADAVVALRRYSLVNLAGKGTVLVHRLVQATAIDQLPADHARSWRQAAAALTEAAIPANERLPAAWPTCAVLLPHVLAVLDLTSLGTWRMASYLGNSGSYLAARDLFQAITAARETVSGAEHPDTLHGMHEVALWTGQAGDPARARDMFAELLPVRERVLGAEHKGTLSTRGNLASWTGQTGDPARARDMYAELLPVQERILGAKHPDIMFTRASLASWIAQADLADQ
jgi:hypothetical protein